jgi:protoheme IX farnesyltransferase
MDNEVRQMPTDARVAAPARDVSGSLVAVLQLAKPNITRMVLITTACGALLAPVPIDAVRLTLTLLGTALVVAAANSLNMYFEQDVDGAMQRTRGRPLPSGRLSPEVATWFGVATALIGLVLLSFWVTPLSGLFAALALVSYAFVYTPLKRVTHWAMHIGAIPGAIPPLIGWAAMTSSVALEPVLLFSLLFVWQIPHFLAIAIFRQGEYEAAGLKVYPSVKGKAATRRAMVFYALLMVAVSLAPLGLHMVAPLYAVVAVPLGIAFTAVAARGLWPGAGDRWAKQVFFASLPYLLLVFSALVLGVLWR